MDIVDGQFDAAVDVDVDVNAIYRAYKTRHNKKTQNIKI